MSDPFITLWTAQEHDARGLSREELARRSRLLRRRVLRRDLIEYAAGLFVTIAFGWVAVMLPYWPMRVACAAIVVGTGIVMWNLWHRRPKDDPAALARDAHGYLRAQLVQQRDTLASVARWYIGPLVPGMALFVMASALKSAQTTSLAPALISNGLVAALAGFVFWGVIALNRHAARALDAQIAALDAERDPTDD